jgi:4'-phosphopantetheinyl transferase
VLEADDIHVWLIPLTVHGLPNVLSAEESARAARFVFERDRKHFAVAHTALRLILADYVGADAAAIDVHIAEKGKPYLSAYPDIRFNLSHSGDYAMLAVAHSRDVGVDIERIRDQRPTLDIAERFFAPAEVHALMNEPPERQTQAFFAIWSRKEAYIKARGLGLGIPLDSFAVSLGADAVLLQAKDRDRWVMCALQAPEGYAAALVAEGAGWRVTQFNWQAHPEI